MNIYQQKYNTSPDYGWHNEDMSFQEQNLKKQKCMQVLTVNILINPAFIKN
jgi:hypothetical protein